MKFHPLNTKTYLNIQEPLENDNGDRQIIRKQGEKSKYDIDIYKSSTNFCNLKELTDIDNLSLHPLSSNYFLINDASNNIIHREGKNEPFPQGHITTSQKTLLFFMIQNFFIN